MKRLMILSGAVLCLATAQAQADDRPALGITMIESTGAPANAGVVVASVVQGSPAAHTGLAAGDRIMSIDKVPVSSTAEAIRILGTGPSNKRVALEVVRGNWRGTLAATLRPTSQVFRAPAPAAVMPMAYYYYPAARPYPAWQYRTATPMYNTAYTYYYPAYQPRRGWLYRWLASGSSDGGGDDVPFIDGSE